MDDDDTGLSTGVARAIRYLRHTGLPPQEGLWTPAKIAIIDGGFDLDQDTGLGSADYNGNSFSPPLQVDVVDYDGRAGGPAAEEDHLDRWHGQGVFGICCAYPRNGYGSAGTGGDLVKPILINIAKTHSQGGFCMIASDVFYAIYAAWFMGADVINMSLGYDADGWFMGGDWQQRIYTAIIDGGVVVASAGNGSDNELSNNEIWPCQLNGVICVGGVDDDGNNLFNWGNGVDIWAPSSGLKTTVTPDSSGFDNDDVGENELAGFDGTSAAAPFVSGIVGLLKAVDLNDDSINLRWDDIQEILQSTANCSQTINSPCPQTSADPHVVKGYVDALRAVQSIRNNPPPTANISDPSDGEVVRWNDPIIFRVNLRDDPAPWGFVGSIIITSDRDGEICTAEGEAAVNGFYCTERLDTLGTHLIRLDATDEWGATSEPDYVSIEIANDPPRITLNSPENGSTSFEDQFVVFNAQVFDADGEYYNFPCPNTNIDGACVKWTSSIDGDITGSMQLGVLSFTRVLSPGEHTITLTAIDGKGATASASSTVSILEGAGGLPTAIINKVEKSTNALTVVMDGRGIDPEDGELDSTKLVWTSDRDGYLGTGNYVAGVVLTTSGQGLTEHIITLTVTDSEGNQGTMSIVYKIIIID